MNIWVALAEAGSAGTMIFDEVDRGVGGAVASAIGERLARLSKDSQVLVVTHGAGFVRTRDGEGGRIAAGDIVHIAAGEEHWHGAAPDSYLLHVAISLGSATWLEPVSDEAYAAGVAA